MIALLSVALIALDYQALSDAQRLFYNGRYEAAAAVTVELRARDPLDLAVGLTGTRRLRVVFPALD